MSSCRPCSCRPAAQAAIRKWMTFYNHQRPHSAVGGQPPALGYWQRNDINQPDQQVQRVA
ncbi:integrase core domain-containing protein [Paracoccus cavernae]|uniref:integrase core domain-containing protein n=1 Tax=Paracoccus cavernae TaxID=1571207 RepID=UPI0035F4F093